MNIYTATKWERRDEMAQHNQAIRMLGHSITHDWTSWEGPEPSPERRRDAGMLDYAGVMSAELLIYWDHPQANGARWEAGMAAARAIPIWLVEYQNPVIFDVLPFVSTVTNWEEAYDRLAALSF